MNEQQRQADYRQAEYRRARLEVAARLMTSDRSTSLANASIDHCLRVADALIAANEAVPVPVPAETNHSGPQSDDLPSTLPTAPSAGDRGAEGEQTGATS